MRTHDLTPSLVVLLGAVAAGALALVMMLMPSNATLPVAEADARTLAGEKPPALTVPALETYAVIADRPLFNAGRTKDPADAEAAAQLAPLSDYRLVGLVISADTQRALVARAEGGQALSLKPGDNLDGRTVVRIDRRGVALTSNGQEEILAFPRGRGRATRGMAMVGGSQQANP